MKHIGGKYNYLSSIYNDMIFPFINPSLLFGGWTRHQSFPTCKENGTCFDAWSISRREVIDVNRTMNSKRTQKKIL